AVPSRTQVEHYRLLKRQVDELVGNINGKHGTMGWSPIWYLYRFLPFNTLAALYSISDICLVTPVRDGMNLIAKEYLATRTDMKGVVVLSEMAGAARELGEAIIVNPNNNKEMVKALEDALAMTEDEKVQRNKTMLKRIQRYTVYRWAEDFMDRLSHTKALQKELQAKILSPETRGRLVNDYRKAKRRLLLLDYDGTLIPFSGKPEESVPGDTLLRLLEKLSTNKKNEVVLISGRDKDTLERWFGNLNLGFAAEHGAWIKDKKNKKWETLEPLTNDWKDNIRPILDQYTDRTPGSFIEEKDFSLAWHYRRSNPELSAMRAGEMVDDLVNLTVNLNLQVLEGSKVVEIKNAEVNKGRAATRWMDKENYNFILAIGDDHTDEDVFEVLPERGYSIRVGLGPSLARFNLRSSGDVVSLLKELI
ncbi:MAG: trehalose-phosphatase, partial [Thermodesulfobacteriota bacterium]|nr:trehalose-phosphatase [Thermodesulfobacteriota bacterium]